MLTNALILFLYPAFGPSKKKPVIKDLEMYKLGKMDEDGFKRYKCIFDNNNKYLIDKFFTDPVIIKLWPIFRKKILYKYCFKNEPIEEISTSYQRITRMMKDKYNLDVPDWWREKFPPL